MVNKNTTMMHSRRQLRLDTEGKGEWIICGIVEWCRNLQRRKPHVRLLPPNIGNRERPLKSTGRRPDDHM